MIKLIILVQQCIDERRLHIQIHCKYHLITTLYWWWIQMLIIILKLHELRSTLDIYTHTHTKIKKIREPPNKILFPLLSLSLVVVLSSSSSSVLLFLLLLQSLPSQGPHSRLSIMVLPAGRVMAGQRRAWRLHLIYDFRISSTAARGSSPSRRGSSTIILFPQLVVLLNAGRYYFPSYDYDHVGVTVTPLVNL